VKPAPVLVLRIGAHEATGRPVLAVEVAMPGDLHALVDACAIG
jgi:hypothetical protein